MASNPATTIIEHGPATWNAVVPASNPYPATTDPRIGLSDQSLVLASRNAFPVVAKQKTRRDNMGMVAGGGIALILGCATFMSLSSGRTPARAPAALAPVAATPVAPLLVAAPVPMARGLYPAEQSMIQPSMPLAVPMSAPGTMPLPGMVRLPAPHAPMIVFDAGSNPAATPTGLAAAAAGAAGEGGTPGLFGALGAAAVAGTGDGAAARSTRLSDPGHTVAQGTLIPAVLETAIDTDLPGYARAVVSEDIRSFDGARVLVPRSSRLIGEYKAGPASGQKRAYLIWTRLLRPDGVSIALSSPSIDFEGQSGMAGKVNDHFFQRFGSAILMSVLGSASALASGGATVVVGGGQSAASIAAQRDGQRSPTIRVRQGEPVRVFTARDLIFAPTPGTAG